MKTQNYPTPFKRSVIGIVYSTDKTKVLLVKRSDVPIWVLPGGGVDPGESPEEAVIREISEETGLLSRITRQTALYSPINRLANHTYVYECEALSGKLSTGDETRAVDFFPLNNIPNPFFFIHLDWLNDARTTTGVIHKDLTQVTYFNLFKYFLRHPIQVARFLPTFWKARR